MDNIKRVISFEYNPIQIVNKAYGLTYALFPIDEYLFEYKINRLLIDTEVFNEILFYNKDRKSTYDIFKILETLKKKYKNINFITFSKTINFRKLRKKTLLFNNFIRSDVYNYLDYNDSYYFAETESYLKIYTPVFTEFFKDNILNISKEYHLSHEKYLDYDNQNLLVENPNIIGVSYVYIANMFRDNNILNIFDSINMYSNIRHTNITDNYIISKEIYNLNKIQNVYAKNKYKKEIDRFYNPTISNINRDISKFYNPIARRKNILELNRFYNPMGKTHYKDLNKFYSGIIQKFDNDLYINNRYHDFNDVLKISGSDVSRYYNLSAKRHNGDILVYYKTVLAKDLHNKNIIYYNNFLGKLNYKPINYLNTYFGKTQNKTVYPIINSSLYNAHKDIYDFSYLKMANFRFVHGKIANYNISKLLVTYKDIYNLSVHNQFYIHKDIYDLHFIDKEIETNINEKTLLRFNQYEYFNNAYKNNSRNTMIYYYISRPSKVGKNMIRYKLYIHNLKAKKTSPDMERMNLIDSLKRQKYKISRDFIYDNLLNFFETSKKVYHSIVKSHFEPFYRFPKYANDYTFDAIIDFIISQKQTLLHSENTSFIIPISRIYGHTLTNQIIEFMKDYHPSFIDFKEIFTPKQVTRFIAPRTLFQEFITKNEKSLATYLAQASFCKYYFNVFIKEQLWIDKIALPTSDIQGLFDFYKDKLDTFIEYHGFQPFDLNPKHTFADINLYKIDEKKNRHVFISYENIFSLKKNRSLSYSTLKNAFLKILPRVCYYKNDLFDTHRISRVNTARNYYDINFDVTSKLAEYYDFAILSNDTMHNLFYDDYFTDISKSNKDANILQVDIKNWAWVYTEEPFSPAYGIDELLLPENDTRYADFENIIWDRETSTPRFPIEQIDDYTFIAKFPHKYPMRDENDEPRYQEIARPYYGIKEDNYFGVKLSVMRQVFLAYYSIWQDHIFEFAQMTMVQASNKMLDYLYNYILMYLSLEDIPHALRVFRQIRWYLESAIIQNSEYKITYVPDDLKSGPLEDNTTPLKTSLGFNTSMYIDTSLHVIRSSPSFLGNDVYLEIYVFNKRNTTFSFSLATNTPVKVYLNNNLIDTINYTGVKYTYNLPYTGYENTIKIFKAADDNVNNIFYIGNVVIPDAGKDGELDIEFDNSRKLGNKALNSVAQKVIAYSNLMNDSEFWTHLLKGNLSVSEAYNKIKEYWDIHWNGEHKGKRLTIKRT